MSRILKGLLKLKYRFLNNPLLIKELRIGLREKKVFIVQTIYMLILGIVAFIILFSAFQNNNYYQYYNYREAGRNFFKALCVVQWILIVLVSPSLTCTAISSERERKTYDMLMVTLLDSTEIILGKITYAASYIFLLLASSLPLVALVFFMGGVSPIEVFVNYSALFAWGMLASAIALFFSSREYRSSVATRQTYGMLILMGIVVGIPYMVYFVQVGQFVGYSFKFPEALAWISIYINVIWIFLFLFYKTANYIRPRAKNILAIHRLFIFAFLISVLGGLAGIFTMGGVNWNAGFSSKLDNELFTNNFIVFTSATIFLLGCFTEQSSFISKKEQAIFQKSLSSKKYFFPMFFTFAGFLLTGPMFFYLQDKIKLSISFFMFAFFVWIFFLITGELHYIFNKRIRPIFIFYPMLIVVNLIPLVLWLISMAASGGRKTMGLLSGIFIQPVFVLLSIWKPDGEFGMLQIISGLKVPTFFLAVIFYTGIFVFLKVLSLLLMAGRKGKAVSSQ